MNCVWCGVALVGKQRKFCSPGCKVSDWRRSLKQRAVEYMGGECKRCGYNRCNAALIFHHPGKKSFGISQGGNARSWDRVKAELDECELLCLNCHAEEHFGE